MIQAFTPDTQTTKHASTKHWYRTIWRWHFYAGLFCIPFIITLAVSGAIYLFKPQIDQWNERPIQDLSDVGAPASPEAFIKAALDATPNSRLHNLRLPDSPSDAVQEREDFSDKSTVDKVVGVGIAAHEGQLFGWFNQLLGVVTALGLVTLAVTGFVLWWKRKPNNALGAPPKVDQCKARIAVIGVLGLGLLLPLAGMSLLALWALEWLVFQRIKPVAAWLGTEA